jgi:heme-degrading monooxygenase HmoA
MTRPYAYAWEYQVPESSIGRFESLYGPEGEWVRLFRRAPGYIGTELLRDRDQRGRYVSVDHWASESAYQAFRATLASEYAAIDAGGEGLTDHEQELGRFAVIGHLLAPSKAV